MFRRPGRNRVQDEIDLDALAHWSPYQFQASARNTLHRHQVGRSIYWKCPSEKKKLSTHWHYSDADSCQIWRNLPTLYQIVHRNNRQCLLQGANTGLRDVNIESDRFWPYFSNSFEVLGEVQYYRWMQCRSVLPEQLHARVKHHRGEDEQMGPIGLGLLLHLHQQKDKGNPQAMELLDDSTNEMHWKLAVRVCQGHHRRFELRSS